MGKTIVIVGVLDVASSTNVSLAKSFIKFGYNIVPVNYRSIIQKYGHQFFENLLISTVKKHRPFLTVFCKCNGINPNIILECNKYTKTWLWNPDPYQTIDQHPEVIEHMKNCTFCSHTGKGVSDYYVSRYNLSNSYHIQCGLDTDVFFPTDSVEKYRAKISFIGNKTKERDEFKEALKEYNPKFYGQGYLPQVFNKEFAQVCSSSDFMLSLNTYNNIPDYFSNRLLRYLGCGVCVLHYDPTETLHKYFDNVLFFSTNVEMINLIETTNKEKAGELAFKGRDEVLQKYTWDHTVQQILGIVTHES